MLESKQILLGEKAIMNKIFNAKNIAIAVITLAIGTFLALGAAKLFFNSTTTVSGNVVSFILNPEGKVDGAILDTGDQVKFGAKTGEVVTSNVQVGAPLTATGHAGTSSDYGRELHAQTLQIGDQTITITKEKKGPKDGKGRKGPKDGKRGPKPPKDEERPQPNDEMNGEKPLPPDAEMETENPRPQVETRMVSGTVKYVLVNKDGNPRGLILSNGEQLNLGKEVENAGLSFDANTNVSAEGEVAKSDFGSFIRAKVLTIGNQTFTFNR